MYLLCIVDRNLRELPIRALGKKPALVNAWFGILHEPLIADKKELRAYMEDYRQHKGWGAFFDCYACAEKKNAWLSRVRLRAHALAG